MPFLSFFSSVVFFFLLCLTVLFNAPNTIFHVLCVSFHFLSLHFAESFYMILHHERIEPITTILGGPDLYIDIGSTINLTCIVRHLPEPPSTISWGHKNQVSEIATTNKQISRCVYVDVDVLYKEKVHLLSAKFIFKKTINISQKLIQLCVLCTIMFCIFHTSVSLSIYIK